jgi:hypothetical protein
MDPIKVWNLGEGGVNVDKNPLRTAPNESLESQNATYDPTLQRLGGLSKRPGLGRFNMTAMGGTVLGGIEAPYRGTAGASGSGGGGFPGDSGGTGNPELGTGDGPGDAVYAVGGGSTPGTGGGLFGGGGVAGSPLLFSGRRLIVIGKQAATQATAGWLLSSAGFLDTARVLNVPANSNVGPPQGQHNTAFPDGAGSQNPAIRPMTTANGTLYYAADVWNQTAAVSATLPTVRRLSSDGNSDQLAFTIPDNPAILAIATIPSHLVSINAMITEWGNGDALYVATYDQITSGASTGKYGRVLRVSGLDSGGYVIQEVYNFFTSPLGIATASVPICLVNFLGSPWFGVWHRSETAAGSIARMVPTGVGTWGIDKINSFDTPTSSADAVCLQVYSGVLYIGLQTRDPSVAHATLWSFTPDDVAGVSLTGTGGTAQSPGGFISMALFGTKLYATYFQDTQASKIYSFDGTTWTEEYAASTAGLKAIALTLWADGSYLYAFGATKGASARNFLVSTDGSTWTDTGAFDAVGTNAAVNLIVGIDQ